MDRRRLPRSIRTQEAEDLSILETQCQRVKRSLLAELLRDCRERQAMGHVDRGRLKQKEIRRYLISSAWGRAAAD
jgi:hypothetical protein